MSQTNKPTPKMVDTTGMSPEDAAAARAAEQARIRKERREAKIKAGGSARLNKITGLGGGLQRGELTSPCIYPLFVLITY